MAKTLDYSIFSKFNFERKPIGLKLLPAKPEGIERIKHQIVFCECIKEAQENGPFYGQEEDFPCVEPMLLGMREFEPAYISGLVGGTVGLFEEARANRRLYQFIPRMLRGSVRYVAFAPIDCLTFNPDVMIFVANVSQAQTLLRAIGFSTGDMWSFKGTPVMACSWLYIYPVLSGDANFTVTGLSLGMQTLNVFPPGLFLIAIPWNRLSDVINNLQDDRIFRKLSPTTREAHFKMIEGMLGQLSQKMSD